MWTRIVALFCSLLMTAFQGSCQQGPPKNGEMAEHMMKPTIEQVQKKHQTQLMSIPGVVGVGIGAIEGEAVIKVLVVKKTPELEQTVPETLEGYRVVIEETGEIQALPQR